MENLPSTEVRMKKNKYVYFNFSTLEFHKLWLIFYRFFDNRCSNCYDCPCCFQTLSTRAVAAPIRTPAGAVEDVKDLKAQPKKVYYLLCSFCRWSSRDAGIPDQQTGKFIDKKLLKTVFYRFLKLCIVIFQPLVVGQSRRTHMQRGSTI